MKIKNAIVLHEILRINLSIISLVIENRCSISRATNLWGKKAISLAIDRIRHCNERHGKVKNDSMPYSKISSLNLQNGHIMPDTTKNEVRFKIFLHFLLCFFLPKLYKSDSFKNFSLLREDTNFKIKIFHLS